MQLKSSSCGSGGYAEAETSGAGGTIMNCQNASDWHGMNFLFILFSALACKLLAVHLECLLFGMHYSNLVFVSELFVMF